MIFPQEKIPSHQRKIATGPLQLDDSFDLHNLPKVEGKTGDAHPQLQHWMGIECPHLTHLLGVQRPGGHLKFVKEFWATLSSLVWISAPGDALSTLVCYVNILTAVYLQIWSLLSERFEILGLKYVNCRIVPSGQSQGEFGNQPFWIHIIWTTDMFKFRKFKQNLLWRSEFPRVRKSWKAQIYCRETTTSLLTFVVALQFCPFCFLQMFPFCQDLDGFETNGRLWTKVAPSPDVFLSQGLKKFRSNEVQFASVQRLWNWQCHEKVRISTGYWGFVMQQGGMKHFGTCCVRFNESFTVTQTTFGHLSLRWILSPSCAGFPFVGKKKRKQSWIQSMATDSENVWEMFEYFRLEVLPLCPIADKQKDRLNRIEGLLVPMVEHKRAPMTWN